MFNIAKELPQLNRELNGIDLGRAHLGVTLIATQDEMVRELQLSSPRGDDARRID